MCNAGLISQKMTLHILKFGGTSVANVSRLENVAQIIKKEVNSGNQVVVVVSAMAGITDQLVGYARSLSSTQVSGEHDLVYAAGEQVTAGLMTLALQKEQLQARSFLSWQISILTDSVPTAAKISYIDTSKLLDCLNKAIIPVVAGFQGVSPEGRLTTLGRGGSDTTAVALAAALKADRCDIYTDVDGVYTADPNLVPRAKLQKKLTYEEMFELATSGAKVLQARAVELAMKHNVRIRVLSSFSKNNPGTNIIAEREELEKVLISGIAHNQDEAKITLVGVYNQPGIAAVIFADIAKERLIVDMVIHSHTLEGRTDLSFTCSRIDVPRLLSILQKHKIILGFSEILVDKNIAKLSVVGVGLRSNLEIPAKLFQTLADEKVNIQMITSSEIKISVIIAQNALATALRAIHTAFNLDQTQEAA